MTAATDKSTTRSTVARHGAIALLAAIAGLWATAGVGGEITTQERHRDATLMAVAPPPGVDFDIAVPDGRTAIARLGAALDALYEASPYSAAAIARLARHGQVAIVFDPAHPPQVVSNFTGVVLASFDANLFGDADDASRRRFPVVVGRYLIKRSRQELAAVLAHELVGHGIQFLEGRMAGMDETDRECEANLYKEQVFQDFGADKRAADMVNFRQQLEWRWCAAFKRYMAAETPGRMTLWRRLDPDVPGLLEVFDGYLAAKGE
jgi:hypothetical protein